LGFHKLINAILYFDSNLRGYQAIE